jgi:hypothetical protein
MGTYTAILRMHLYGMLRSSAQRQHGLRRQKTFLQQATINADGLQAQCPDRPWITPILCNGYRGVFPPVVKRDVNHSSSSSTEVKNVLELYFCASLCVCMACYGEIFVFKKLEEKTVLVEVVCVFCPCKHIIIPSYILNFDNNASATHCKILKRWVVMGIGK